MRSLLPPQLASTTNEELRRLRSLYTNQKYFFATSAYQSTVLLQFNSGGDSLSYEDIELGTGMNAETLKPVLQLLSKQRVIDLKEGMYELNLGAYFFRTRGGTPS